MLHNCFFLDATTTQSNTQGKSTTETCSTQPFSPIVIVLAVVVIMFGLLSLILSVALVTVCVRLHANQKRYNTQPVKQPAIEEVYDEIVESDNNTIKMKQNKAYQQPKQDGGRHGEEEAAYDILTG